MNGFRFGTCALIVMAWTTVGFAAETSLPDSAAVRSALSQSLTNADGESIRLESMTGRKGTVLVFLSTECPISNGYVPTLNRLHEEFARQGIAFIGVNSNEPQTLADVAAHAKKFDIQFPVLKDAGAVVAEKLGIETCPMVLLLDDRARPVYQGRIDDRYTRRGGGARDVRRADLEMALTEFLAGKNVAVPRTEPIGCPLLTQTERPKETATAASVTYSEHVSRVLQKHCQECHRPGGAGPFSLMTYDDAVSWGEDVKTFTANRTMPPWMPKSGHDRFENARVMSDAEIQLIATWVDSGMPEGDPTLLPEPKTFRDGWQLGEPDLVLTPGESFTLAAEGKDEYRCFVLPTNLSQDAYVKAMEVLPGNRAVVHHVLVFLDATGRAMKLDAQDPLPGFGTTAGFPGFLPTGGLGGWAPGNTPEFLPDGVARKLARGATVVMQVHYHKTGKVEEDRTKIGLYFAKEPIERVTRGLPLMPIGQGPLRLRIPPGEKHYEVKGRMIVPREVEVLGITPHMHLLGQDMKVTARRPDGTEETLIDTRWNFNWQESYRYKEPVRLPRGTVLQIVAHYDNSEDNPHNPNHPPKEVRWGEQTFDEMCFAFMEVTSPQSAETPQTAAPDHGPETIRDALRNRWRKRMQDRFGR